MGMDDLLLALQQIVALDPEIDSDCGWNEWGEAECFRKAQYIAKMALHHVHGGLNDGQGEGEANS